MTSKNKITIAAIGTVALVGIGWAASFSMETESSTRSRDDLCDIERGRWCTTDKIDAGEQPQEDWLCCLPSSGTCVVTTPSDCAGGILGWCDDYTEDEHGAATCHD